MRTRNPIRGYTGRHRGTRRIGYDGGPVPPRDRIEQVKADLAAGIPYTGEHPIEDGTTHICGKACSRAPWDARHRADDEPEQDVDEPESTDAEDEPKGRIARIRAHLFGADHIGATATLTPAADLATEPVGYVTNEEAAWAHLQADIDQIGADALDHFRTVLDEIAADWPGLAEAFVHADAEIAVREVEEVTAELVFEPAPRWTPTTRPPGKAARRAYHRERRLIGATA